MTAIETREFAAEYGPLGTNDDPIVEVDGGEDPGRLGANGMIETVVPPSASQRTFGRTRPE